MSKQIAFLPTKEEQAIIDELVQSGAFRDSNEVLHKAMDLFSQETPASKRKRLLALIDEGLNSPDSTLTTQQIFEQAVKEAGQNGW